MNDRKYIVIYLINEDLYKEEFNVESQAIDFIESNDYKCFLIKGKEIEIEDNT